MLSNPLHQYSPYNIISNNDNNSPSPSLHPNHQGLQPQYGALGSHAPHGPNAAFEIFNEQAYGAQQMQHLVGNSTPRAIGVLEQPLDRQASFKQRPQKAGPMRRLSVSSGPVRRRISRACDQCNQLRTKCDGKNPCAHCVEFGLGCEYAREKKKRGKASRKDLAERAAALIVEPPCSNGNASDGGESSNSPTTDENGNGYVNLTRSGSICSSGLPTVPNSSMSGSSGMADEFHQGQSLATSGRFDEVSGQDHTHQHVPIMSRTVGDDLSTSVSGYGGESSTVHGLMEVQSYEHARQTNFHGYSGNMSFATVTQNPTEINKPAEFQLSNSPVSGLPLPAAAISPEWNMTLPSPSAAFQTHSQHAQGTISTLRYPVLEPLLPDLLNIIPAPLACDLIDFYFATSSSASLHPVSPHILGSVFRKRALVHPTNPRVCQPALLASMLWVAAQTNEAPLLTSPPSARGKICQQLLDLTLGLLKPLMRSPSAQPMSYTNQPTRSSSMDDLGMGLPGSHGMDGTLTGEPGVIGAVSQLDDLVTYIHLATVVSASEYKKASVRWWNVAWSLARELRLGRELPPNEHFPSSGQSVSATVDGDEHDRLRNSPGFVTEEEREERRRIWWLVYTMDRHLALCYNRPLFLLDVECEGLLQPMPDMVWQNGDFKNHLGDSVRQGLYPGDGARGPQFECRGYSTFGYFLPLMTILGEIVDLHHARNHPRFGPAFRISSEWENQTLQVRRHLELYENSLERFASQNTLQSHYMRGSGDSAAGGMSRRASESNDSPSTRFVQMATSRRMTDAEVQTRTVVAYGTHVMHVLHILLEGKWDPTELLDDGDLWITSEGFASASGHAVAAAEAINDILEYDPGLEFMPFFFGAYLLQGSFLLLLVADKLQDHAAPNVVKACETIVRAHDACVVTLSTEYQRKFSKVMRGALALVRGRVPEDLDEQIQRRRELLGLYRWTGDGTGLAL